MFKNLLNLFKKQGPTDLARPAYIPYSTHYNKDFDFNEDFYINLRKTIAWTEQIIDEIKDISKINYAKVLRTTNPVYKGKPFYTFGENEDDIYVSSPELDFDYNVVLAAALGLRKNTNLPERKLEELGRILQFEIDITTFDGAPCSVNGFVDEADIPPIDTWFYITRKYLYCWIPTLFIGAMQDVIDVEILGSYHWLDVLNPELNQNILYTLQHSPTHPDKL